MFDLNGETWDQVHFSKIFWIKRGLMVMIRTQLNGDMSLLISPKICGFCPLHYYIVTPAKSWVDVLNLALHKVTMESTSLFRLIQQKQICNHLQRSIVGIISKRYRHNFIRLFFSRDGDANAVFWTEKLELLLPNFTLSDDFLWGTHKGFLVLTLQMTPNQKPQHSFFWLMKYALDSNHSPVNH